MKTSIAFLFLALTAGQGIPDVDGLPVCPFPPEGPGVCQYCPCPFDYYTPCELGVDPDCNSLIGTRNGVVGIEDLLYILDRWGEAAHNTLGCGDCTVIGDDTLVELLLAWGPCEIQD